jgi:uncharacterized spore protein YtfJ
VNKVISVTKVNFGIGVGLSWGIKKVRNEGKGTTVFLDDFVEPAVVHA